MKFVSKIVLYSWKGCATAHLLMEMCTVARLRGWGARRAGKPARQQENPPCTVGLCSTFPHCAPRRQQKNPVCTVGLCSTVSNPGCTVGSLPPPADCCEPLRQELQTGPSLYATDMDWWSFLKLPKLLSTIHLCKTWCASEDRPLLLLT